MRKVKLFFLLTVLLAIAQGAWADTKTFSRPFVSGNNTQSPVTVNCNVYNDRANLDNRFDPINITITVSAGYIITEVKFTIWGVGSYGYQPITATNGTLSNNTPSSL